MIPRTADWKNALATAIRDPAELLALLDLPKELLSGARRAAAGFPLRVPRGYAALMAKGDLHDPLLRQVLPVEDETIIAPGFVDDPVGDRAATAGPGLLHKYHGRVLLLTTGACAIHCRYCFRRHFPYGEVEARPGGWDSALERIARQPEVEEVILSGGDPLLVDDGRLAELARRIAAIGHVRRLRLHTRLPVVLPERIDEALLGWLQATKLQTVIVVHANHPNELGPAACNALGRIRETGVTLLNQTVLMRGVNDDADALIRLSTRLFDAGVLPYYLHQLDPVHGAAHFQIDDDRAKDLRDTLQRRLPGYLVPRLARELAGETHKRLL